MASGINRAKKFDSFDVTCECTKQITSRIGQDCQCNVIPKSGKTKGIFFKSETAKLLKVDKLQI